MQKGTMMKEFIVISSDGQTFDKEGFEIENDQVLDYIEAENAQQAQLIAANNINEGTYGAFEDFSIFEKRDRKDPNEGLYIFLRSPANIDFVDNIIDDTAVEIFYDKRTVLIKGILSIREELLDIKESGIDVPEDHPSIVKEFASLQENEDLLAKLDRLNDENLLNLWKEMESLQFEEYVNHHIKIKNCENKRWL